MIWTHKPRLPILIWCLWLFPFTLWDTLYLALRPHSLPGGKWHDPYFAGTFTIWASIDHSYGEQGFQDHDGFVIAQSLINMSEAILCICYMWTLWASRVRSGGLRAKFGGRSGARAVLIGFCAGCVTLTKTALYFLRECLSGYRYTGHNEWKPFIFTWVGMNMLYTFAASYMMWSFGLDIVTGLQQGTERN